MPESIDLNLDAVVFGGGVAGLWTLDALARAGRQAVLIEANRLGAGQTVCAQGIIHGGLKYTLTGALSGSAKVIRAMPDFWRDCLAGRREPRLTQTRVRAVHCHLWRTDSLKSRVGMIGAKTGLQTAPKRIDTANIPEPLRACPGDVFTVAEPVIDPVSLLEDLAAQHATRLLHVDTRERLTFDTGSAGEVRSMTLTDLASGMTLSVQPTHVVFTAGGGNAALRERAGLASGTMQRRPLHMVMLRGDLPAINGHCVDGAATRATITADTDSSGRTVWQVGGQIAERGVEMDQAELIAHARSELTEVLPGVDFTGAEWATYRVDRAEGLTPRGRRPEEPVVTREGNTVTAWPTKLALAPMMADRVLSLIDPPRPDADDPAHTLQDWPRPTVASPPWETADSWTPAP